MSKIGACGDNCEFCHRNIATQSGLKSEIEKVKELWVRIGLRDESFPAENLKCYGCKPENKCPYSKLRDCVFNKGIENCGFCNSYPCALTLEVFDKSDMFKLELKDKCTKQEYEMLIKAFCMKKDYLDKIHKQHY